MDRLAALGAFVEGASSAEWQSRVRSARNEFKLFCIDELDKPYASTTPHDGMCFLLHVFNEQPHLAASTISALGSALSSARQIDGLEPLSAHSMYTRLLTAFAKRRPHLSSFTASTALPYAPHQLVQFLPTDDSFASVRLRALFTLRTVTLMRPSAPLSVRASSIRRSTDLHGRPIVVFKFNSKSSNAAGVASDSNYVEFVPDDSPLLRFCPARNLLCLLALVTARARSLRRRVPDCIFVSDDVDSLSPLSKDRCSSLIRDLLRRAGLPHKSHSLRAASNQMLQVLNVPADTIALRAGWASVVSNVRHQHYTQYRLVAENFAVFLLSPPPRVP